MKKILTFILAGCVGITTFLSYAKETKTPKSHLDTLKRQAAIAVKIAAQLNSELAAMGINSKSVLLEIKKNPKKFRLPVPTEKRKRIIAFTEEHDKIISQGVVNALKKQNSFINDPENEKKLQCIAEKITSVLPKKIEVKIYIIKDDTVNAACLPDGTVFINSGTLKNLKDENMLAAIIAHEYGHAVARHGAENITKMLMQKAGEIYVSEYAKNIPEDSKLKGSLLTAGYGLGSKFGFALPYSRVMEYEADKIGVILLHKSGYDVKAAVELMKYLEKTEGGKTSPFYEYISTHPATAKRIKQIEKFISNKKNLEKIKF